jgi:hypothetical protein
MRLGRLSLAVFAAFVGIACSREGNRVGRATVTSSPAPEGGPMIVEPLPTTQAGRTGVNEDRAVAEMIRVRMLADPALKDALMNVQILVLGNVATLRGSIKTAEQKSRAEQDARSVTNIQSVDNELEVTSP